MSEISGTGWRNFGWRNATSQLKPESGSGIVGPDRAFLDIPPHDAGGLPTTVSHDGELWSSLGVALGGESGSKRVPGKQPVEADSDGAAFQHVGNGSVAKAG